MKDKFTIDQSVEEFTPCRLLVLTAMIIPIHSGLLSTLD